MPARVSSLHDDGSDNEHDNDDLQQQPTLSDSKVAASIKSGRAMALGEDRKEKPEDNLMWVEKYRPTELSDLISHQDIINTISKLIDENKLPHLLLYGPPGTGKTSTILAAARRINGPKYQSMILELNASDDRGISVVRDQIRNFASSRAIFSKGYKLIILDEADQMTRVAQFALRRVIEKYAANARFCILANYINKIIPALQSRCTRFRFGPLDKTQIRGKLELISKKENVKIDDAGMDAVIKLAEGDMRKCLNVLQSCHSAFGVVTEQTVYQTTGLPLPSDVHSICTTLLNEPFQASFNAVLEIQSRRGLSLTDIVSAAHEYVCRTSMPPRVLAMLLDRLADIEYRLAFGTNEKLQLAALVGIFHIAKEQIISIAATASSSSSTQHK